MTLEQLRYPIGKWVRIPEMTDADRAAAIGAIAAAPAEAAAAVAGLTDTQLDTPYRDGGWSPRQIVHHLADSHMNAFSRFKLGLTEDTPTITPYDEEAWCLTADATTMPVDASLVLLDGLHRRWVTLLNSIDPSALARTVLHPEHKRLLSLSDLLGIYAWHGRHHVAQITAQRERLGW